MTDERENAPVRRSTSSRLGAVTGRAQKSGHLESSKFNLHDGVQDRSVICYLAPGQEDLLEKVGDGARVRVFGRVYRDSLTGSALSIRDIVKIEPLD